MLCLLIALNHTLDGFWNSNFWAGFKKDRHWNLDELVRHSPRKVGKNNVSMLILGFTITDYDSNLSCKFHKFSYTFGPHVVALTTSCIAADRLVAVMFPIQYKNHATEAKGYLVGSVAMLLGFFIASPWLALSQLVADKCIIGEWNDVVYQLHAYASKYDYSGSSQSNFSNVFRSQNHRIFKFLNLKRM